MALSPEVKQIVDALSASARGQLASSAGLEKVDTRLKDVEDGLDDLKTEIRGLVEELKEQNIIERTGQKLEQAKIEHAQKLANRVLDRIGGIMNSKPAMALYAFVAYCVLNWVGISPDSIRAFIVSYLGTGAPGPGGP